MTRPSLWRAIPAALIAAALFVTLGSVVAVSSEGSADQSVTVGQSMLGDRVAYDATLTGDWPYGADRLDLPYRAVQFEWRQGGPLHGNDTRLYDTDRVDITETAPEEIEDENGVVSYEWATTNLTRSYEAGKLRTVSAVATADFTQLDGAGNTSVLGIPVVTTRMDVGAVVRFLVMGHLLPDDCLVANVLQGTTVQVGDMVNIPDGCAAYASTRIPDDANLTAAAVETVNGWPTVRLDLQVDASPEDTWLPEGASRPPGAEKAHSLSLWVADGLAYPVRFAWASEGRQAVLDLVGLEVGQQPRGVAGEPGPAMEILQAPRPAWTLPDEGVAHPFPLSEAFQAAASDPRSPLGAFLADEPDAYVSWAWDVTAGDQGGWWMDVTGEDETLTVVVHQRSGCAPVCSIGPVTLHDYTDFGRSARRDTTPAPSQMPDLVPTVASLLDVWAAYADPSFLTRGHATWGFRIECDWMATLQGQDCVPVVAPEFGREQWENGEASLDTSTVPPTMTQSGVLAFSKMERFSGRADLDYLIEFDITLAYTSGLAAAPPPSMPPPAEDRPGFAPVLATMFFAPDATTAGIGAFALLMGALYWLWPALKGGGIGLFSRQVAATVLDHPQRARILQVVEGRPGIHFNALLRETGLGNGTLSHHVDVLLQHRQLRRVEQGGYTCFFPVGASAAEVAHASLKSPGSRRVLQAIQATPGRSNLDVAEATGLDPATVHYHVQRLVGAGLVDAARHGRTVLLRPTALADSAS
jgi:hypothetical protein